MPEIAEYRRALTACRNVLASLKTLDAVTGNPALNRRVKVVITNADDLLGESTHLTEFMLDTSIREVLGARRFDVAYKAPAFDRPALLADAILDLFTRDDVAQTHVSALREGQRRLNQFGEFKFDAPE